MRVNKKGAPAARLEGADWDPAPYQIEGVQFLLDHAAAGLLLKPG